MNMHTTIKNPIFKSFLHFFVFHCIYLSQWTDRTVMDEVARTGTHGRGRRRLDLP